MIEHTNTAARSSRHGAISLEARVLQSVRLTMTKLMNLGPLPNVGVADAVARVFFGVFLVYSAFIEATSWGWVGLYPMATGIFGVSPIYLLLSFSTHRKPAH
jgi:hypothetical protein